MNPDFISKRITELRIKKGIAEHRMSLELGQNKNYINTIETGNNFPNMNNFFSICEYLHITPQRFFQFSDSQDIIQEEFVQLLLPYLGHSR